MDTKELTPVQAKRTAIAISEDGECYEARTFATEAEAKAFRDGFEYGTGRAWSFATVRAHVHPFVREFDDDEYGLRDECVQECERALRS